MLSLSHAPCITALEKPHQELLVDLFQRKSTKDFKIMCWRWNRLCIFFSLEKFPWQIEGFLFCFVQFVLFFSLISCSYSPCFMHFGVLRFNSRAQVWVHGWPGLLWVQGDKLVKAKLTTTISFDRYQILIVFGIK